MLPRLTLALCAALLLAISASWATAQADDPDDGSPSSAPLTVAFQADAPVCTAGSQTQVHWQISGGAKPYQITLNGNPTAPESTSAPIPCGDPLNIPTWLREVVQPSPIEVELKIADADGSEVHESLRLNLALPLPAPAVNAGPRPGWGYGTWISAQARGVGADHLRHYLVRWRVLGSELWNYHTNTAQPGSSRSDGVLSHDIEESGVRVAIEVAQVRSLVEQATPELLNWSATAYATTESEPLDLTAVATHDTITVSWGPAAEGLMWTVTVSPADRRDSDRRWLGDDRSEWAQKTAGPAFPYAVRYDGLLPDTLYYIRVGLQHPRICETFEPQCVLAKSLSVHTAPAPPGWSREPRRPQNVQAIALAGGDTFLVTWEPPLEGEERMYAVIMHEYGAPRPAPITPVGGVRGPRYTVRLPSDTTYEVFVRHLGIEDEESRVIWEPPPAESETLEYMTLPNWHVEHRRRNYDERDRRDYKFVVTWDADHRGRAVQVRWLKDGYAMTHSAEQSPIVIWAADPGPHSFQLRLRQYNRWSQWSSALRVSAPPPRPESLYVREQQGMLIASWSLPTATRSGYSFDAHDLLVDHIDGFRAYLHRVGEPVRVLDVGMATNAEFPIPADGGEYEVHVASYSNELGEGRATAQAFSQAEGPTLMLWEGLDRDAKHCDRVGGIPALVHWEIQGGAAPYSLQVADDPIVRTTEHEGLLEVQCADEDTQGEEWAEAWAVATVTDAYGRVDRAGIDYTVLNLRDEDGEPMSFAESRFRGSPDLALGRFAVTSRSLTLRWNSYTGPLGGPSNRFSPPFTARWREVGTEAWQYRIIDDERPVNCRAVSSKWPLDGLTPSTEYEVQIALYDDWNDLTTPERLDWSESRTGRTLPDEINSTLQRRASDVVVSWPAIPEATNYVVTLHAAGVSWWKVYKPQGGSVEEAVFADVPAALTESLQVEVTIRSAMSTDTCGPIIEDYAYCD